MHSFHYLIIVRYTKNGDKWNSYDTIRLDKQEAFSFFHTEENELRKDETLKDYNISIKKMTTHQKLLAMIKKRKGKKPLRLVK